MKISLEPTAEMQRVNGVSCRIWKGVDDHGVPIIAHVACVSPQTHDDDVAARHRLELHDVGYATREPISLRSIL